MSTTLRIEELKKKFDENPRRYFAPLANEYRKAGDLQQAISICQAHLPQQPGHMSGHIVYGQALFEARQFDQARTVFETALALDPENLIALRYLGDIAFELGDRGGARSWYTRVLETDPRNEEIAALMAAMGDDRSATSRESGPTAVAAPPAPQTAAAAEPPRGDAASETAAASANAAGADRAPQEAAREAAPAPSDADAELEKLFSRPKQDAAQSSAPGREPSQPASTPNAFSPLSAFGGPSGAAAPPSLDQPAPSLAAPTFEGQRGDDAPLQNPPSLEGANAPSRDGAPREQGFVTETMAQLYLKQGFHDRALDVYRQLVGQSPNDRALRERMELVEREVRAADRSVRVGVNADTRAPARSTSASRGGPTVRQFLAGIGTRRPGMRGAGVAPPPGGGPRNSGEFRAQREEAARAASGGSIDALFAATPPSREDVAAASTLADAFNANPSASPDAQMSGRPAHPAATELSLDHVFRDGSAAPSRASGPVSYDQFFSQPTSASAQNVEGGPTPTAPAPGSDDIEQFNAWLQGLKKR
jgi:tetratricopeptide (TPR) repeat protein